MEKIAERIEYGGCMIGKEEVDAIVNSIESQDRRRWTIGPESREFEKELAETTGVKYAVLVNSGSSALLAGILGLNLPEGSKVVIPALTFPTAYSSILQAGLIPVVIDCDRNTLNLDYKSLRRALKEYPDIKAVVAVHIAGNPVDLKKVREIVGDRYIVSDNCDAYGSTYGKDFIDKYADVSMISMHAAHIISMGEGGAVLTDNKEIADRARKVREWGRESGSDKITKLEGFPDDYRERYVFTEIGYNLKPLELQCAMGRIQLRKLPMFKKERKRVHDKLTKALMGNEKFELVKKDAKDSDPCWFCLAFHCVGKPRKEVMQYLEEMNIETRTVFSGNILKHPAYKNAPHIQVGSLEDSNYVMENSMFIGSPPFYTYEQISYIEDVMNLV